MRKNMAIHAELFHLRSQYEDYRTAGFEAEYYRNEDDWLNQREIDLLEDFISALIDYSTRFPKNVTFRYCKYVNDCYYTNVFDVVINDKKFHCAFQLSYFNIMVRLNPDTFKKLMDLENICRVKVLIIREDGKLVVETYTKSLEHYRGFLIEQSWTLDKLGNQDNICYIAHSSIHYGVHDAEPTVERLKEMIDAYLNQSSPTPDVTGF